jgi:hypothetical protein
MLWDKLLGAPSTPKRHDGLQATCRVKGGKLALHATHSPSIVLRRLTNGAGHQALNGASECRSIRRSDT